MVRLPKAAINEPNTDGLDNQVGKNSTLNGGSQ